MKFKIGSLFSGLFLTLSIIYIIYKDLHITLFKALSDINIYWFIIALSCALIYVCFEATILWLLVNKDQKYPYLKALKVTVIGLFFSGITPFNTGGQPAQIIELKNQEIGVGKSSSYLMIKFIIYQAILVVYTSLVLVYKLPMLREYYPKASLLVMTGFTINIVVILSLCLITVNANKSERMIKKIIMFLNRIRIIKSPKKYVKSTKKQIEQFHDQIIALKSETSTVIKVSICTILQLTFYFLVPYFIYRSFGLNTFNWHDFIASTSFVLLITAFIPLPGGSGGAEGSFYYLFSQFFIGNLIVPAILIWRVVTYYLWMFIGAVIIMIKKERSYI